MPRCAARSDVAPRNPRNLLKLATDLLLEQRGLLSSSVHLCPQIARSPRGANLVGFPVVTSGGTSS